MTRYDQIYQICQTFVFVFFSCFDKASFEYKQKTKNKRQKTKTKKQKTKDKRQKTKHKTQKTKVKDGRCDAMRDDMTGNEMKRNEKKKTVPISGG